MFEIRKPIEYNITRYTPTDNTTALGLLAALSTSVAGLYLQPASFCFQPFAWGVNNDYSTHDPVKSYTITNRLGITTLDCLTDIASRYFTDVVVNKNFTNLVQGNQMEQFHTDGIQWYTTLHDPDYEFVRIIDTWIPSIPYYESGGIGTEGSGILWMAQYVKAMIRRMAYTGELDKRLPRAVTLLMNSAVNYRKWIADTGLDYSNAGVEIGAAMQVLVIWAQLTNDPRVNYVLKDMSDYGKLYIQPDFQLLENLNLTSTTPDSSNAMAVGYIAYWKYTGDKEAYDLGFSSTHPSCWARAAPPIPPNIWKIILIGTTKPSCGYWTRP